MMDLADFCGTRGQALKAVRQPNPAKTHSVYKGPKAAPVVVVEGNTGGYGRQRAVSLAGNPRIPGPELLSPDANTKSCSKQKPFAGIRGR